MLAKRHSPDMTADDLKQGLADTDVAMHPINVQYDLHTHALHEGFTRRKHCLQINTLTTEVWNAALR